MRNRYGDRILSAVVGNANSGESAFKTDGNNIFLITYNFNRIVVLHYFMYRFHITVGI